MAGIQSSAKLVIFSDNDPRILEVAAEIARQRGLSVVASLRKPVAAEQLRYVLEHISLEMFPFDEVRLRECLRSKSLRLHYQPKIDLATRRITGVEALLRCQDSRGRQISSHDMKWDGHDSTPGGERQVTRCTCGRLTLKLGTLRIEFSTYEFAQLDRLVATAMKRFELETSDAAVSCSKALTH